MNENTFGDVEQYKMLPFLTEKINELENANRKAYLSQFIIEFNTFINKFESIQDIDFRCILLDMVWDSYYNKTNYLIGKYEGKIVTYMRNYIKARVNNMKN